MLLSAGSEAKWMDGGQVGKERRRAGRRRPGGRFGGSRGDVVMLVGCVRCFVPIHKCPEPVRTVKK